MYSVIVTSILLLLGTITTTQFAQAEKNDEIVASIGDRKITLSEFNKKYSGVRTQSLNPPTRSQFLEDLVRYEVGLQEAEKKKLDKDPTVQDRMRQEMYKALLEKELGDKINKIQVSDAEMKEWYKKNPQLRSSHILIEMKYDASPEQRAEAKKRALEILAEVKKSKRPFEELVKLYSDDPMSKPAGGDVGWQSPVTIMPSYYNAISNLKIGEIFGLVDTQFGYHIVKLTGRRAYENADKSQIRIAVFDEKRKQAFNEFFDKLKKQYSIKVNPSSVN